MEIDKYDNKACEPEKAVWPASPQNFVMPWQLPGGKFLGTGSERHATLTTS